MSEQTTEYVREEAEAYRRTWGCLPTGWTEQRGIDEERRRSVAAWGSRHAMCFGRCQHTSDRCDGGEGDGPPRIESAVIGLGDSE